MLGRNRRWGTVRVLLSFLVAVVLVVSLVGCGDSPGDKVASGIEPSQTSDTSGSSPTKLAGPLSEVAPPPVIQQLSQSLEAYQPQVAIISPSADEVLQDTTISVRFQVQDLPIFKDPDLGLGSHLHVILDNQPYKAVYDLNKPLVFEDLTPSTHTLRVFASRPWHESFKNEGAYAQTKFHIFTKTDDNNPDPALPLLTYSRPTGNYGAEPIMLDFYLTNAPLHLVAQESGDDEIADWRIRVTANGQSFVLDRWQPVYLKGFKPGESWVQLEFLDEQGNSLKNVFNNTVRLIKYEPKGKDTLSKLVRGELSAEAARGIVDPNYKTKATPTPSPAKTPVPSASPTPSPTVTPTPIPSIAPSVEETPSSEPAKPEEKPTPEAQSAPTEAKQKTDQPKSGGFFGRFRRPAEAPIPSPAPVVPEEAEQTPKPEESATPIEVPKSKEEPTPAAESVTPDVEQTPVIQPVPIPIEPEKPKFGGFFSRFRRSVEAPNVAPEPSIEPEVSEPQPEGSGIPSELPESKDEPTPAAESVTPEVEQTPVIQPVPIKPIQPEKTKSGSVLQGFRGSDTDKVTPDSGLPPTLPEIVETRFPKLSEPEAAFPQPEPSIAPEAKSSPDKQLKAASKPESLPDKAPAAIAPKTPATANPEPAEKPKLDLKEVFLPSPALSSPPKIIKAPAEAESNLPSRYLKKSVPDASNNVPEALEVPAADS